MLSDVRLLIKQGESEKRREIIVNCFILIHITIAVMRFEGSH